MEQEIKFKWNGIKKELTRSIHAINENKVKNTKTESKVEDVFNKEAAIKLKTTLFTQLTNAKKFIADAIECKDLAENDNLPMRKEFEDIMKAEKWKQDKQMQNQYVEALKQLKAIKEQYKKLDKALPDFNV